MKTTVNAVKTAVQSTVTRPKTTTKQMFIQSNLLAKMNNMPANKRAMMQVQPMQTQPKVNEFQDFGKLV